MRIQAAFAALLLAAPLAALPALAQTTQPAAAKDVLDSMLKPDSNNAARPLQPITGAPVIDSSTGGTAVAPGAPQIAVLREGSYVGDRVGRLSKAADGSTWEFTFESDGRAMKDPPLKVLPNLKLQLMEDQLRDLRKDLKFRVTGMVTEFRGRNHVLFEKVVVLSD